MIDGQNFFDQSVQNDQRTYDNIPTITIIQGNDYTAGCWLDYVYFKSYCKVIAIDLSKQQALDPDLKAIQQINFFGNLDRAGNITMLFIIKEAKETILDFSQGTVRALFNVYFLFLLLFLLYYNIKIKLLSITL